MHFFCGYHRMLIVPCWRQTTRFFIPRTIKKKKKKSNVYGFCTSECMIERNMFDGTFKPLQFVSLLVLLRMTCLERQWFHWILLWIVVCNFTFFLWIGKKPRERSNGKQILWENKPTRYEFLENTWSIFSRNLNWLKPIACLNMHDQIIHFSFSYWLHFLMIRK